MRKARQVQDHLGWAYTTAVAVVRPTFNALMRTRWIDGEKIPAQGGCILAVNHISHVDPLVFALFVYENGRLVRYLAKQEIFETPVLKDIAKNAQQIPVLRESAGAASAFDAAVAAVNAGECVGFYPEGTITRDPELWPMVGKTGAARVALSTGCPVIPVGQWGAHEVLYPYAAKPDLFPRKTVTCQAGDPVDLADLQDQPPSNEVLREATDRIMAAISGLVADIRGEPAPPERFDPRKAGVRTTGNPHKEKRKKSR